LLHVDRSQRYKNAREETVAMKNLTITVVAALAVLSFAGCKKKGGETYSLAKMEEFKAAMCKCTDRTCAEKVDAEMMKWSAENQKNSKGAEPTAAEKGKSEPIVKEMLDCRQKALGADAKMPAPATPDPAAGSAAAAPSDLPVECNDYKAMIEKLASCEKMPKETRDALKLSYDTVSKTWTNVAAMPEESRKTMANGCKQGADALKAAAASTCGW
jgi:hypothetical protein